MDLIKVVGYAGVAILVANFLLFSFRVINYVVFWIVLIATSVLAFMLLHFLKKKAVPKKVK